MLCLSPSIKQAPSSRYSAIISRSKPPRNGNQDYLISDVKDSLHANRTLQAILVTGRYLPMAQAGAPSARCARRDGSLSRRRGVTKAADSHVEDRITWSAVCVCLRSAYYRHAGRSQCGSGVPGGKPFALGGVICGASNIATRPMPGAAPAGKYLGTVRLYDRPAYHKMIIERSGFLSPHNLNPHVTSMARHHTT